MAPRRSTPLCTVRRGGTSDGLGVFATEDITVGQLIIEEPYFSYVEHTKKDPDELPTTKSVNKWAQARKRLPGMPEPETVFKTLVAPFHHWKIRAVYNIFCSNGYSLEPPPGSSIRPASAIFETMTRVNHSCLPNAIFGYDWGKGQGCLRACREIKLDEEITIAYRPDMSWTSAPERRADLQESYGFSCNCEVCAEKHPCALHSRATRRYFISETIMQRECAKDLLEEKIALRNMVQLIEHELNYGRKSKVQERVDIVCMVNVIGHKLNSAEKSKMLSFEQEMLSFQELPKMLDPRLAIA